MRSDQVARGSVGFACCCCLRSPSVLTDYTAAVVCWYYFTLVCTRICISNIFGLCLVFSIQKQTRVPILVYMTENDVYVLTPTAPAGNTWHDHECESEAQQLDDPHFCPSAGKNVGLVL